jgi:hypothetical protein
LNAIGFRWTTSQNSPNPKSARTTQKAAFDSEWARRFEELKLFRDKHGHIRVPCKKENSLYNWTLVQRRTYEKNTMNQDRIDALNSVGFEWINPRQVFATVPSERWRIIARGDRAALPQRKEPQQDLESARPKKIQKMPKITPISLVNRASANDTVEDFHPPQTVFKDIVDKSPPRQGFSKVVPECSGIVRRGRSAALPETEEPQQDPESARPKKSRKRPENRPTLVSRASANDNVGDYHPPRAVFEDVVDSPPIIYTETYTAVYTVDLHQIRTGLKDETMDVDTAIDKLKKMVRT